MKTISPDPGYVWEVKNATIGCVYDISTYTFASCAYLPKEVEVDKKYSAYFYFTRIGDYSELTYPVCKGILP